MRLLILLLVGVLAINLTAAQASEQPKSASEGGIGDYFSKIYSSSSNAVKSLANTVQPYVDKASEEVPKLINQAGPAITKVGGQVRDGITGAWDKLTTTISQQVKDAPSQAQVVVKQAEETISNDIWQY